MYILKEFHEQVDVPAQGGENDNAKARASKKQNDKKQPEMKQKKDMDMDMDMDDEDEVPLNQLKQTDEDDEVPLNTIKRKLSDLGNETAANNPAAGTKRPKTVKAAAAQDLAKAEKKPEVTPTPKTDQPKPTSTAAAPAAATAAAAAVAPAISKAKLTPKSKGNVPMSSLFLDVQFTVAARTMKKEEIEAAKNRLPAAHFPAKAAPSTVSKPAPRAAIPRLPAAPSQKIQAASVKLPVAPQTDLDPKVPLLNACVEAMWNATDTKGNWNHKKANIYVGKITDFHPETGTYSLTYDEDGEVDECLTFDASTAELGLSFKAAKKKGKQAMKEIKSLNAQENASSDASVQKRVEKLEQRLDKLTELNDEAIASGDMMYRFMTDANTKRRVAKAQELAKATKQPEAAPAPKVDRPVPKQLEAAPAPKVDEPVPNAAAPVPRGELVKSAPKVTEANAKPTYAAMAAKHAIPAHPQPQPQKPSKPQQAQQPRHAQPPAAKRPTDKSLADSKPADKPPPEVAKRAAPTPTANNIYSMLRQEFSRPTELAGTTTLSRIPRTAERSAPVQGASAPTPFVGASTTQVQQAPATHAQQSLIAAQMQRSEAVFNEARHFVDQGKAQRDAQRRAEEEREQREKEQREREQREREQRRLIEERNRMERNREERERQEREREHMAQFNREEREREMRDRDRRRSRFDDDMERDPHRRERDSKRARLSDMDAERARIRVPSWYTPLVDPVKIDEAIIYGVPRHVYTSQPSLKETRSKLAARRAQLPAAPAFEPSVSEAARKLSPDCLETRYADADAALSYGLADLRRQ